MLSCHTSDMVRIMVEDQRLAESKVLVNPGVCVCCACVSFTTYMFEGGASLQAGWWAKMNDGDPT